jgi:hypothetical protein
MKKTPHVAPAQRDDSRRRAGVKKAASHKSAEPNSLVVRMDFAERDALLEGDPNTSYLKEHYVNYPCVLVRLSRVRSDALRDLVIGAHRFVNATAGKKAVAHGG